MRATHDRIQVLRRAIAEALDRADATPSEAASAMASALLDIFVDQRARGNEKVREEMLRMAARVKTLAAAEPHEVEALAIALADITTAKKC